VSAKKTIAKGARVGLTAAIESFLRTGSGRDHKALVAVAKEANEVEIVGACRALRERKAWPAGIKAIPGNEQEIFQARRSGVLGRVLARELNERQSPETDAVLLELIEGGDAVTSDGAQSIALGRAEIGKETKLASLRVLEQLASHLRAGDALMPGAAVARFRLGANDIAERLAALDDGGEAFQEVLRVFAYRAHELVPLSPALWDLYRRRLPSVASLLADELERRAPPSILIHALATTDATDCDLSILVGLRARLDRASAPALLRILPRLRERPLCAEMEKLAQQRLRAGPRATAVPARKAVVATDGGPVVLGCRRVLSEWAGALPDMPTHGDYHDACAEVGLFALQRSNGLVFVLSSHTTVVDVYEVGKGVVWLVLAGSMDEAWSERESLRFEPLSPPLDGKSDALVLLDAAYTLARARREEDRAVILRLSKAVYAIERAASEDGTLVIVRLSPMKAQS
jgi:hypothetical protein